MFCHKCGAQLDENAIFCNKCGASVGMGFNSSYSTKMSKKEYFASTYCTDGAKRFIKTNWILYWVFCAVLIFTLITAVSAISKISNIIDDSADMDFAEYIESLEAASGVSIGFTEEDYETFEAMEQELGLSVEELIQWVLNVAVGTLVFFNILILIFLTVAVLKKSTGFAVTSLVLAAMYSGRLIVIGLTIAILVLTVKLNREYKEYCNYYMIFPNGGMSNGEPDFR